MKCKYCGKNYAHYYWQMMNNFPDTIGECKDCKEVQQ